MTLKGPPPFDPGDDQNQGANPAPNSHRGPVSPPPHTPPSRQSAPPAGPPPSPSPSSPTPTGPPPQQTSGPARAPGPTFDFDNDATVPRQDVRQSAQPSTPIPAQPTVDPSTYLPPSASPTPQGPQPQYQNPSPNHTAFGPTAYVTLGGRIGANLIDTVLALLTLAMAAVLSRVINSPLFGAPVLIIVLAAGLSYLFIVLPMKNAATIGKAVLGQALLDGQTNQAPGIGQLVARLFSLLGYSLTCGALWLLSAYWVSSDARRQSAHDKLVNTVVVRSDVAGPTIAPPLSQFRWW